MPIENGVNWQPLEPEKRGRHSSFGSALDAALKDLMTMRDPFFDMLVDNWKSLPMHLPMWPGRRDNNTIVFYVRTAATLFAMRPKLPFVKRTLAKLPDAPKDLDVRLEIHSR